LAPQPFEIVGKPQSSGLFQIHHMTAAVAEGTATRSHSGAGVNQNPTLLVSIAVAANCFAALGTARRSRHRAISVPYLGCDVSRSSNQGQPREAAAAASNRNGTVGRTGRTIPTTPSGTKTMASNSRRRISSGHDRRLGALGG
jgi:hypothetical protein